MKNCRDDIVYRWEHMEQSYDSLTEQGLIADHKFLIERVDGLIADLEQLKYLLVECDEE